MMNDLSRLADMLGWSWEIACRMATLSSHPQVEEEQAFLQEKEKLINDFDEIVADLLFKTSRQLDSDRTVLDLLESLTAANLSYIFRVLKIRNAPLLQQLVQAGRNFNSYNKFIATFDTFQSTGSQLCGKESL